MVNVIVYSVKLALKFRERCGRHYLSGRPQNLNLLAVNVYDSFA